MAHQGKLIEQGLVAQLVAANTAAGARVHRDRVDPFKKGSLPAIALYIPDEEVDNDASEGTAPRELKRDADVEMQLLVGGVDAEVISDAMWDFQEQVENALDADPYIGGAAADAVLKRSSREIIEANGHSDPLVGVVTLVYTVTFRTQPGSVTATDDFLRVDAKHDLVGGVDDTEPAEDLFDVRSP